MQLLILMANISVSFFIVESTSSPERRMLKELLRISVVNITLLRLTFDGTGVLAAPYGRGWRGLSFVLSISIKYAGIHSDFQARQRHAGMDSQQQNLVECNNF
jgi:hypothetical protein